ncbi:phosphonate metabolism protein PhnM [Alkaliphilus metalliredigens QYMF]|uniref:Phosphonate metabolism protein PhnM n=1 Tax=Alkaliphilus metalliredigens (strain QYMF) TaxID=293826 RepID=A6TMF0_ALKMQ|nr:phosphonate metabolism protein PhnM [Alkaliphilus metalliredigens]ABR47368.1 phosphonate metabolism protein PhnM [Alkaliphilus metalliredigens QYMF]
MIVIKNGKIITENEILQGYDLYIKNDRIEKIQQSNLPPLVGVSETVDAQGAFITPGFVDIHADYIEHMTSPRPTSLMDFTMSIRETEKVLINNGITTMFHSLSLNKKDDRLSIKPVRYLENVKKFVETIHKTHLSEHLIRHRFHARLEIDNFDAVEDLKKYIHEKKVHLISFMDHSPGQGQYRDLEMYRNHLKGYRDFSEEELDNRIEKSIKNEKLTIDMIKEIAEIGLKNKITIASHDDDSLDKLDLVRSFGTQISEFPIDLQVAKYAKKLGMDVLVGAPNILLGGSHSGNLSAVEAILNNCVNILCSDYYPAAILHAIFILEEKHNQDIVEMFKLATINPAKAVNMDNEIGSIKENKKADLLLIEKLNNEFPKITKVFVDGEMVSTVHYRNVVNK